MGMLMSTEGGVVNWLLTLAGLFHLALIPLLLTAMLVDPKVITGANAWIKPLKFAVPIVEKTTASKAVLTLK